MSSVSTTNKIGVVSLSPAPWPRDVCHAVNLWKSGGIGAGGRRRKHAGLVIRMTWVCRTRIQIPWMLLLLPTEKEREWESILQSQDAGAWGGGNRKREKRASYSYHLPHILLLSYCAVRLPPFAKTRFGILLCLTPIGQCHISWLAVFYAPLWTQGNLESLFCLKQMRDMCNLIKVLDSQKEV